MFGLFSRSNSRRRNAPPSRRVQLGVESLEGRALPSVSPILATAGIFQAKVAYFAPQVANIQGLTFHLISSSGKPAHDLTIQTETFNCDGSATFTGTWKGYGPNGPGTPKQIMNGKIFFDAAGNMKLSFSWTNGSGGQNNFLGTLTRINQTSPYIYAPQFHLDGDVTTAVPGDGPGHVSGNGMPPPPVMAM